MSGSQTSIPEPVEIAPVEIDRGAVALIVAFAVVVVPATMVAAAWILTSGFKLADASIFEVIVAALSCVLALFVIRVSVRELRGAIGLRIDGRGLRLAGVELAWSEVERLDAPAFGVLELEGAGKQVQIRTYLFRERVRLLETIAAQTGKQVPEKGYSY